MWTGLNSLQLGKKSIPWAFVLVTIFAYGLLTPWLGFWGFKPWIAVVAAISIVITASYIIRIIGRVFGQIPKEFEDHVHEVHTLDKVALVVLSGVLILVGVIPGIMVPLVQSGVENVLRLLGGA